MNRWKINLYVSSRIFARRRASVGGGEESNVRFVVKYYGPSSEKYAVLFGEKCDRMAGKI